jgi:hypothetical protein
MMINKKTGPTGPVDLYIRLEHDLSGSYQQQAADQYREDEQQQHDDKPLYGGHTQEPALSVCRPLQNIGGNEWFGWHEWLDLFVFLQISWHFLPLHYTNIP